MNREDVLPIEGFESELGLLAATLQDGTREWRENLGLPPNEAVVWQAYENGPSIGGLLLHLASCESYWIREFASGVTVEHDAAVTYDLSMDQYGPFWPAPPAEPIDWYFETLDRHRALALKTIRTHREPARLYARKESELTFRWIVAHIVEHDSYHGGQAVLLHEIWKKLNSR